MNNNPALKASYGDVLNRLNEGYKKIKNFALTRDYYLETTSKIELFTVVQRIRALNSKKDKPEYAEALIAEIKWMDNFLKEMSLTVDKDLFAAMMQLYLEQPSEYIAPRAKEEFAKFKNYKAWADDLYSKSIFANQQKVKELLNTDPRKLFEALDTDLGAQLVLAISNLYDNEVAPQLNKIQTSINQLQRLYMKAQMEVFTGKTFYPDANSTLRVAFGNVNGYSSYREKIRVLYLSGRGNGEV
ncbi:S46 family peptidase [Niabella sp. W65]|nr:S46 family peptidase [Niabella sp. W65]MCH7369091.1 S46 family peptidase [Niabella sp. W65]ULT44650.1 S46 family peptidase [Niabella sp. I65]